MRIIIASKQPPTRQAIGLLLRTRLNAEIVGDTGELEGLTNLVKSNHPDIVLLDEGLVQNKLDEVLASLRMLDPSPAVIVLAKSDKVEQAALAAGADKTVLIGSEPKELLIALQSVQLEREDI
jgi:DNA-binding NarL/FixJ family response regulator